MFLRARADHDRGHVAHIHRAIVARGHEQQPDIGDAGQGLAGGDVTAYCPSSRTCPVWNERLASRTLATSCCRVTPRSASFSGSGSTRICLRTAAGNIGQADIFGLHQFGAQLVGELIEVFVGPALGCIAASVTE